MINPYRIKPPEPVPPAKKVGKFVKLHLAIVALWGAALICDTILICSGEMSVMRWVNFVAHVCCVVAWSYVAWTYKKIDAMVDCDPADAYFLRQQHETPERRRG
jgi:hypothetical protein